MSTKAEQAAEIFKSGFNCAQAVFSTYSDNFGINRTDALRISCGFGGGMGRKQEVCGAVTGAIMLIGCKHGKTKQEDTTSTDETYKLVRDLSDKFTAKHGSILCKELLGCNLTTPEGQKTFKDQNMKELRCSRYVHDAVEMIEDILAIKK
jgi:C_GCAxxG_C_C family probable redox protein